MNEREITLENRAVDQRRQCLQEEHTGQAPTHILHSDLLASVEGPASGEGVQVPEDTVPRRHSEDMAPGGVEREGLHRPLVTPQSGHQLSRVCKDKVGRGVEPGNEASCLVC